MNKHQILTFLLILFSINLMAQNNNKLPGDTTLPSSTAELEKIMQYEKGNYKYSIEDFFSKPKQSNFKISPNGLFLAFMEKDDVGKRHIYIKNTTTKETKKVIEEKDELIRGYTWANNNTLLYLMDKGGNENYQLFSTNIDGSNNTNLTPFENVKVDLIDDLKEKEAFVIIEMNKENPQIFEPYLLNINNGELKKLYENTDTENPIVSYSFNKEGELKSYTKQKNGVNYVIYYKPEGKNDFEEIMEIDWKDNFEFLDFAYTSQNLDDAYVLSNIENNTNEIILYDFKERKKIKTIYKNEIYDAKGISLSRKRNYELDFCYYNGEKSTVVPFSATFKNIKETCDKQFKNYTYTITGNNDNEDKFLIYVYSDKHYGSYYLYNTNNNKFTLLIELMPQLKEEDMAEIRPISFTSRDGLTLHGYLTLPKNTSETNKTPLIVHPHGGPYGPRDIWYFNTTTQLFASRGYATIQINYRGSGGYGKDFYLAGSKQIGRKMLDDLEDGVAYAISLGFIDKEKIAIYGGSYGGLATLGSLVKTPDLYTCGVDYVGVSNLFTFFKSFPPYWKPYMATLYEQWYDENNPKEAQIMAEVSPALNVDKIKKPLLIVQGANDPRVNINESDQVVVNLRKRGVDVPYMVKYDEGHGFHREGNNIELHKIMMGFFAKYLKQ